MMRRFMLVLSVLALVLLLPTAALARQTEVVHTVEAGETLNSIAALYGVDAATIAQRNGLGTFDVLRVGQLLIIPDPVTVPGQGGFVEGGTVFDTPAGGAFVPQQPAPLPANSFVYIVQPGDRLSVLALRFGTTVAAIAAANGIANPNLIFIGQRLVIPVGDQGGGVVPPQNIFYTVQPGDRLSELALRFGTTVAAIASLNNITNVNRILVGQVLTIPVGTFTPPPINFISYVVQPGDTLDTIATRFGTTLSALLNANPQLANPGQIFPGQVLQIPLS